MIDFLDLYGRIQKYRIEDDSEMPKAYQNVPGGRPLHDDWLVGKSIPRIMTAYKIPMPFKKIAGTQEPIWTRYLEGYPLAPDTEIKFMDYYDGSKTISAPHILTMHPICDLGWSRQSAFIDGEWRECFYTSSSRLFGRRVTYYYGLRLDPNYADTMAWFPEASLSWK